MCLFPLFLSPSVPLLPTSYSLQLSFLPALPIFVVPLYVSISLRLSRALEYTLRLNFIDLAKENDAFCGYPFLVCCEISICLSLLFLSPCHSGLFLLPDAKNTRPTYQVTNIHSIVPSSKALNLLPSQFPFDFSTLVSPIHPVCSSRRTPKPFTLDMKAGMRLFREVTLRSEKLHLSLVSNLC